MEIINHCASEEMPVTFSQVFNRTTNGANLFQSFKEDFGSSQKADLFVL